MSCDTAFRKGAVKNIQHRFGEGIPFVIIRLKTEPERVKGGFSMSAINVKTPLTAAEVKKLKAGDIIALTGYIYTARDAAHKRMLEEEGEQGKLPFDIEGQVIYYAGPSPEKPGQVIGSAGPTTSYRMDAYAPRLIKMGLKGMIGKGIRSKEVIAAMKEEEAVYLGATGGAGALLSNHIKKSEIIAYEDLGAEAIRKLYVEDFPLIVVIDSDGGNLYESEPAKYKLGEGSCLSKRDEDREY